MNQKSFFSIKSTIEIKFNDSFSQIFHITPLFQKLRNYKPNVQLFQLKKKIIVPYFLKLKVMILQLLGLQ